MSGCGFLFSLFDIPFPTMPFAAGCFQHKQNLLTGMPNQVAEKQFQNHGYVRLYVPIPTAIRAACLSLAAFWQCSAPLLPLLVICHTVHSSDMLRKEPGHCA